MLSLYIFNAARTVRWQTSSHGLELWQQNVFPPLCADKSCIRANFAFFLVRSEFVDLTRADGFRATTRDVGAPGSFSSRRR